MRDKRKGKLDKHFNVLIENKKVPVLSYKLITDSDGKLLTLKTLMKSEMLPRLIGKTVKISIATEKETLDFLGECYVFAHLSALYEVGFRIFDTAGEKRQTDCGNGREKLNGQ